MRKALLLLLAGVATAAGADLRSGIREILDSTPTVRNAFWGIQIAEVGTGRILYESNAYHYFVPASNTKLFSTALGISRLGGEHRFHTRVFAARAIDASGRVAGSLTLYGGGDPNLSGRPVPYLQDAPRWDPLARIEELAGHIVRAGLRRVDGDVIGDDTMYVWEPFPEGWALDDPLRDYGAPVSALTIGDNSLRLTISPGRRDGDPALISLYPPLEYYHIDNRVDTQTRPQGRIFVERQPGSFQVRLRGSVERKGAPRAELLGIEDPALYAAVALRSALARRGVTVFGRAVARHRFANEVPDLKAAKPEPLPEGVQIAGLVSAPLSETLGVINKVSQNLHAEMLIRAVGLERRGIGSRHAGLAELGDFLEEIGILESEYDIVDGSGLSRLNLVTPAAVIKLLLAMYGSQNRAIWLESLPLAGEDGTLRPRFAKMPGAGRIRAKTGTLSHVSALSGYAERRDGGVIAFSILVNNYRGEASEIRAAIDRISSLLVE